MMKELAVGYEAKNLETEKCVWAIFAGVHAEWHIICCCKTQQRKNW